MEPLITLVSVTALLLLVGALGVRALRRFPTALRGGLAAMFMLTGVFPANIALSSSGATLPWHDQLHWRTLMQLVFIAATSVVAVERYGAWKKTRATALAPRGRTGEA